jgi:ubiquinone/menaquinone biosynthesis C-methylase UbiE
MLNNFFKEVLERTNPESLVVFGSSAGNGFEHLINRKTKLVKAIDINPEYCEILKHRFSSIIRGLEVECSDLSTIQTDSNTYDLAHCALIFEYVDVEKLLVRIKNALKPGGWMSVVLQQPGTENNPVTKTSFKSLEKLGNFMHLIPSGDFREMAVKVGFEVFSEKDIVLDTGKKFYSGIFKV